MNRKTNQRDKLRDVTEEVTSLTLAARVRLPVDIQRFHFSPRAQQTCSYHLCELYGVHRAGVWGTTVWTMGRVPTGPPPVCPTPCSTGPIGFPPPFIPKNIIRISIWDKLRAEQPTGLKDDAQSSPVRSQLHIWAAGKPSLWKANLRTSNPASYWSFSV